MTTIVINPFAFAAAPPPSGPINLDFSLSTNGHHVATLAF